jgi:tRNA dimethylallyltransferase
LPALQEAFAQRPKPYASMKKHLILLEREASALKVRVSQRAEGMLKEGLIDEVKGLLDLGIEKNPNAAGAIGYRETIAFLKGTIKEDELHALIVKNTQALVKKQRTWMRSQLPEPDERIRL